MYIYNNFNAVEFLEESDRHFEGDQNRIQYEEKCEKLYQILKPSEIQKSDKSWKTMLDMIKNLRLVHDIVQCTGNIILCIRMHHRNQIGPLILEHTLTIQKCHTFTLPTAVPGHKDHIHAPYGMFSLPIGSLMTQHQDQTSHSNTSEILSTIYTRGQQPAAHSVVSSGPPTRH
jgi:hypothetical protein